MQTVKPLYILVPFFILKYGFGFSNLNAAALSVASGALKLMYDQKEISTP